jgi:hypothetical protein
MASIEKYLLKKNIAKNPAHAKVIMLITIIACLIIIVLINRPDRSNTNIIELTDEQVRELELQEQEQIQLLQERGAGSFDGTFRIEVE